MKTARLDVVLVLLALAALLGALVDAVFDQHPQHQTDTPWSSDR